MVVFFVLSWSSTLEVHLSVVFHYCCHLVDECVGVISFS